MTGGAIRTERLTLRPLRPEDADPIADMIGVWDVVRWLTMPPFPYRRSDAEWFIASGGPGHHAITRDDTFMGVMTLTADLGYWLGRPFHGQGYATEAARALLTRHFATGGGAVTSGHLLDNAASRRVLLKLGFRDTAIVTVFAKSHWAEVEVQRMVLEGGVQ
jgi:RimJ/RimL family protein N-acetyltransferase